MTAGDLTASTPTICVGTTAVETALDALNLAATTDFIFTLPIEGRDNCWIVFKVERAAA